MKKKTALDSHNTAKIHFSQIQFSHLVFPYLGHIKTFNRKIKQIVNLKNLLVNCKISCESFELVIA